VGRLCALGRGAGLWTRQVRGQCTTSGPSFVTVFVRCPSCPCRQLGIMARTRNSTGQRHPRILGKTPKPDRLPGRSTPVACSVAAWLCASAVLPVRARAHGLMEVAGWVPPVGRALRREQAAADLGDPLQRAQDGAVRERPPLELVEADLRTTSTGDLAVVKACAIHRPCNSNTPAL
jgi:hypothetical protein